MPTLLWRQLWSARQIVVAYSESRRPLHESVIGPAYRSLGLSGQDDTPEIVYLGSGANEEQLEKLADEFLLGDRR
jgi:hypothetical protein